MILSVSRRTDIPACYADWFFNRIREGFVLVRNPLNPRQISRIAISPEVVDCIVFWTKNPLPMMGRLHELAPFPYYFQFTLTGYGHDIEQNLPDKTNVLIPAFQRLSEQLGRGRVVWRYDPILISPRCPAEWHLRTFEAMAERLAQYTDTVVISFLDRYKKINAQMNALGAAELLREDMISLAAALKNIADRHGLRMETCAEQIDLSAYGIAHGQCISRTRIEQITGCRLSGAKDKNQRPACGCFESIDIGAYDTCRNGCLYCYANQSRTAADRNFLCHDPSSPLLCGRPDPADHITERSVKSLKISQLSLFDML